jgi:predicted PurR-regulated permease PerM
MAAKTFGTLQNTFFSLGALIFVVVILYFGKTVLVPVCLAVLLAFILTPLTTWFEQRGLRRIYAALLSVLISVAVLAGIFSIVATEVRTLAVELPKHKQNIMQKLQPIYQLVNRTQSMRDISKELRNLQAPTEESDSAQKPIRVEIEGSQQSSILSWVPAIAQPALETLGDILFVVVLVSFILVSRENMRNRLIRLAAHGQLTSMTKAMDEATQRVSRYLISQLGTNSLVGVGAGIAMAFVGIPYAFLWGLLTIALRFIPYLGVWIAAFLPFALSVVIFPHWTQPLVVVGVYLALELITANVIEPLLFAHNTGVSPAALLVVAVFWLWLWGPIGLLLSTPLTVCLVVAGKYVPYLEFFDVLLGDEPALDISIRFYQRLLAKDRTEATTLLKEFLETNPLEKVYDEFFLAAIVHAKRDRQRGELDGDDAQFLLQAIRELLRVELAPQEQPGRLANGQVSPEGSVSLPEPSVQVIASHAGGEEEDLALELMRHLLEAEGWALKAVPPGRLRSAVKEFAERGKSIVCVAAIPPGALVRLRGLCQRLRASFPQEKIVAGRWGQTEDIEPLKSVLRGAGADDVATTMLETREQIRSLLGLPAPQAPVSQPAPQAAAAQR